MFFSEVKKEIIFYKLSHKEFNSIRLNTLLSLNPFYSDFKENIEKKQKNI